MSTTTAPPSVSFDTLTNWAHSSGFADLDPSIGFFELSHMSLDGRWSGGHWIVAGDIGGLVAAVREAEATTPSGIFLSAAAFASQWRSRADITTVLELVYDLDCAEGMHKDPNLPPLAQAREFVESLPVPPTFLIKSGGGGLHARWALDKPAVSRMDEVAELQQHMLTALSTWGDKVGKSVDLGPTKNLAGILRLPGTVNRKGEPVLVDIEEIGPRHELDVLMAAFQAT